jgi:hypothetical protein
VGVQVGLGVDDGSTIATRVGVGGLGVNVAVGVVGKGAWLISMEQPLVASKTIVNKMAMNFRFIVSIPQQR